MKKAKKETKQTVKKPAAKKPSIASLVKVEFAKAKPMSYEEMLKRVKEINPKSKFGPRHYAYYKCIVKGGKGFKVAKKGK